MKRILFSGLAAAGLLSGCGGEPDNAPAVPAPAPSAQPLDISLNQALSAPPETAAAPASATAAAPVAQLTESEPLGGQGRPLTQEEVMLLNYGISMFKEEKGRYPTDLQEAVASRHIARLPKLPAGEKFTYNAQNGTVKVESTN